MSAVSLRTPDGASRDPERRSGSPFTRDWSAEEKAAFVPLIRGPIRNLRVIEGHSLADFIRQAVEDGAISQAVADLRSLVIIVGGVEVPRQHWRWVRPKANAVIMVAVRATGGRGKSILRTVLMLSVVILAAWVSAGALVPVFGEAFAAGSFGAIASASVVSIAGNALVNAIAPVPQQKLRERSQSYTFTGSQNQLKPYAPCTIVFGKHRVVPPYCMQWHTSMYGDSVIFYGLFQVHVGKCQVSDLKIGDTLFSAFLYAGMQARLLGEAYDPGTYDLIPNVVREQQEQLELKEDNGWETRSFPRNASELSFDLAFPAGLNDGEGGAYSVVIEAQYRKVGSSTWIDLPTAANASYVTSPGTITFNEEYYAALRRTFHWTPADGDGDYELHLKRNTVDDLTLPDDSWLVCMRAHRPEPPVTNDDICVIALFMTATNQISGVIDQFSCIVEPIIPTLDELGTWSFENTSRNPAAHLRWLHTGPAIAPQARLAGTIFDETLADFYDYCVDADLTCDHVVDYGPSVEDLAQTIASCGNAHIGWERGKRRIVIDRAKQATQMFTASTVRGFKGRIQYGPAVHALKATFLNEDKDWEPDECVAYADGYDETTAVNIETAEVPGKTRYSDVWRTLRRILKRGDIRREDASFDIDVSFLETRFGERAYLEHFALSADTQSGWVRSVAMSGSDATGVTLDESLTFESGTSYGIRFRRGSDGALVTVEVQNPATVARTTSDAAPRLTSDGSPRYVAVSSESATITFATPLTGDDIPAAGDLFAFGPIAAIGMDCSITGIAPARDDTASISVVPYSDTLFSDDADVADYRITSTGSIRFLSDGTPRRLAA